MLSASPPLPSSPPPPPRLAATPAPVWRRALAAVYDGLLVAGLALTGTLLLVAPVQMAGQRVPPWLEGSIVLGLVFAFFGWCWTHGGQTLGLRAWRLQVRRIDGRGVGWPAAAARFAVGAALLGLGLWAFAASGAHAALGRAWPLRGVFHGLGWALGALLLGWLPGLFDARRRALGDFLAGTETVFLPPGAEPLPPVRPGAEPLAPGPAADGPP